MISRKIDAKILISNLSDDFLEKPEHEFPVGKLVKGRCVYCTFCVLIHVLVGTSMQSLICCCRVLAIEPLSKRVEVTLRTSNMSAVPKSDSNSFNSIVVGEIISGKIKRVESFGLFIYIDRTNVVSTENVEIVIFLHKLLRA